MDNFHDRAFYRFRAIGGVYPRPIEQEANRREGFALTLTKSVHELGKSGRTFDLKKDLVVVVCDFDVEVLGFGLVIWVASSAGGLVTVGHRVECVRRWRL